MLDGLSFFFSVEQVCVFFIGIGGNILSLDLGFVEQLYFSYFGNNI